MLHGKFSLIDLAGKSPCCRTSCDENVIFCSVYAPQTWKKEDLKG
jgi:hypothetical protein